jgi:hypothetical protein
MVYQGQDVGKSTKQEKNRNSYSLPIKLQQAYYYRLAATLVEFCKFLKKWWILNLLRNWGGGFLQFTRLSTGLNAS